MKEDCTPPLRHPPIRALCSDQPVFEGAGIPPRTKRPGPVTAVNMFNIRPDKLESFVAVWPELVEFMTKQPGFRSSTLLRALLPDSRFQLINIAEWDSAAELHA